MRSSFEGMEGMEGMIGSVTLLTGGGPSPGGLYTADRVDLPFVTVGFRNPGSSDIGLVAEQRLWPPRFPEQCWSADWYACLVLTQFAADVRFTQCEDLRPEWARDGWNTPQAREKVDEEIRGLVDAARDERANALPEILDQNTAFIHYFLDLLNASTGYPATARLLTIASLIGGFCVIYYKGKYQRPRPTMVCPALMPPVAIPGHASFPSGHSTQAHLMARCLGDILAGEQMEPVRNVLRALADRIARNREIAGLHYPSDSKAGKKLAKFVHERLLEPSGAAEDGQPNWYGLALEAARVEWRSRLVSA